MLPYPRPAALLIACVLSSPAFAQLSFNPHEAASLPNGSAIGAHGDFNGDGREDMAATVYDSSTSTFVQVLYLSTADGTYGAPKSVPAFIQAIGDFNHDGKLDFASQSGGNPLSVYLGNGDGTFQAPKVIAPNSTVQSILAVDLNHDSKTDLVVLTSGASNGNLLSRLQIWISNGDGTFTAGQSISSSTGPVANQQAAYAVTGDFDGDGKPDIALIYGYVNQNSQSVSVPSTVQVWYGDGAGHLGATPSYFPDPNKNFDSVPFVADLNNDGKSDIVFRSDSLTGSTAPTVGLLFGTSSRTFSYKSLTTGGCPGFFTVADFNGDGLNDVAYTTGSCTGGTTTSLSLRLGAGSGNFGAEQNIYQSTDQIIDAPFAARTTLDTKPDIVIDQFNGTTASSLEVLTNESTGSFPGCGLTGKAEGITVCSPGASSTSPVKFSIGAAGPTPMRTAAVWADGQKMVEQKTHAFSNYSFLDSSVALAAGSHAITIVGTGWDNTIQSKAFTLTVSASNTCTAPSTAGVNVCSPVNGSSVSSPVQINAAATVSGGVYRFELWSGSTKLLSVSNSGIMNQSLALASGSYHLIFDARNSAGTHVSATRDITVK